MNIHIKLFSVESINFSKRYWVRNKAEEILVSKMTLIFFLHLEFKNSVDKITFCPITPIWHTPQHKVKLAVSV